jgi:hypothetical protein
VLNPVGRPLLRGSTGPSGRTQPGRPVLDDELRARAFRWPPLATCPDVLRPRIGRCRSPAGSPVRSASRGGRGESSRKSDRVRRAPRFLRGRDRRGGRSSLAWADQDHAGAVGAFGQSLAPTDRVALEVTSSAWELAGCCQGGRGEPSRYRDSPGAGEDRGDPPVLRRRAAGLVDAERPIPPTTRLLRPHPPSGWRNAKRPSPSSCRPRV